MIPSSGYFIFVLIGEAICIKIFPKYDITVVSYKKWPENGIWDISKVRLIGRERLINGTITLNEDMDNKHYFFSLETFSDAADNGNFKVLPFHVSRMPVCEAFKKFRALFSKNADYGRHTDFPIHKDICPIPKGTYYLKNIRVTTENWPAILPHGYVQGNFSYDRDHEAVGSYLVTALIKDKEYR